MKKILVTGGAGFIGSHTVIELYNAGYQPIIADNFSNSNRNILDRIASICGSEIINYEVDCCNYHEFKKLFADHQFEGVIHFAAFKAVGESVQKPMMYFQNNIGSMAVLLNLMEQFGVNDLVFSSSCTVYGIPDRLPVTELSPIKPAGSPYGYTKQVCEQAILYQADATKKIRSVLLRYFNPIGAHPCGEIGELPLGIPNNLIPYITQTAAGLRPHLQIFGDDYPTTDGTCIRDYIHVVDLAKAHVAALNWLKKQSAPVVEIFNVGTGKGNSVKEVISDFEQVSKEPLKSVVSARRPGDVAAIYADTTKATQQLNWTAELTLQDALRDAWRWQKSLANNPL